MWRYFGIGKGKKWKHTDAMFHASVKVIKDYHATYKFDMTSSSS